jgi:hypothetical protein
MRSCSLSSFVGLDPEVCDKALLHIVFRLDELAPSGHLVELGIVQRWGLVFHCLGLFHGPAPCFGAVRRECEETMPSVDLPYRDVHHLGRKHLRRPHDAGPFLPARKPLSSGLMGGSSHPAGPSGWKLFVLPARVLRRGPRGGSSKESEPPSVYEFKFFCLEQLMVEGHCSAPWLAMARR